MNKKRYRVKNGILRFEDDVIAFRDYLYVPEGISFIDFNKVLYITKVLDLRNTNITHLDLRQVITISKILLPDNCMVTENLYNGIAITGRNLILSNENSRMINVGLYNNLPLIYLSGSVVGDLKPGTIDQIFEYGDVNNFLSHPIRTYLDYRLYQANILLGKNYNVYSPGNHMTVGDVVADMYPKLVFDIDIDMLERSDVILFDLTNLTPGTSAELGYCVAKGWIKKKRIYYIYHETKNFFINGLTEGLTEIKNFEEFLELESRYYENNYHTPRRIKHNAKKAAQVVEEE